MRGGIYDLRNLFRTLSITVLTLYLPVIGQQLICGTDFIYVIVINHLTPNAHFNGLTSPLTYRCCIFYLFNK